jgi:hypothetical protein
MTYQEEIESLINSFNLPHKLIVSYALACAKSVNTKEFGPIAESLKCIELIEKWLVDDKSVTNQELLDATYATAYAVSYTVYAVYAVYDAAYATYAARAAACAAAHAASSDVDYEKSKIKYKDLLFETIKIKYGELGISLLTSK